MAIKEFRQFFSLVRGEVVVADGVIWPNGDASMKWRGYHESVVYWPEFSDSMTVHGHDGTHLVFGYREETA